MVASDRGPKFTYVTRRSWVHLDWVFTAIRGRDREGISFWAVSKNFDDAYCARQVEFHHRV